MQGKLAGLPCAHPENYNDRILENITGPYTVSTRFNQCTTDGTCVAVLGCTDPEALNYVPAATEEDGSCVYFAESTLPIIEITTQAPFRTIRASSVRWQSSTTPPDSIMGDAPTDYDGQISIEIRGHLLRCFQRNRTRLRPKLLRAKTTTCPCSACRKKTIGSSTGPTPTKP